jgi:sensor histidine kinase regulating citrate/malate metabolism
MNKDSRSQVIGAALVMIGAIAVIYFLPSLVLWIGQYSAPLAFVVGALLLLAFFGVFWLRARYQRGK